MEQDKEAILLPICQPVSFLRVGPYVREETRRRMLEMFVEDLKQQGLSFFFEEEKDGHIITAYTHVFAFPGDRVGPLLRKVSLTEAPFFQYVDAVEIHGSKIVAMDGKIGFADGCVYDIIDVPPGVRAVVIYEDGEEHVLEPGYYLA